MTSSRAWGDCVARAEPLAPHTNMRIGGPAQYLARPPDVPELRTLLNVSAAEDLTLRVLGGNSRSAEQNGSAK